MHQEKTMFKLYWSKQHPGRFIAHSPETGWVVFPDAPEGWAERKPVRGLDPVHLRQVPLSMAANAGLGTTDMQRAA
jgi:hypothetical protein